MAIRIPWNEQETLLLFDVYEKIQKNPDKKSALTTALSINLRRMAVDRNVSIDETFRNYTGISMRLSEIDKILHPDNKGLSKTSELFRSSADLYAKHRRTFMKKVLELDEYRVKLLADMVGFDLIEAVVLLDAYLGIGVPGETKEHTARLISAKLRTLAINRGRVINEAFRSDKGILGRLKKMEAAFGNANLSDADIPQVFVDAVNLYYENRSEYKRLLQYANSIIGKIILPEDAAKIEKAKQQAKDASPVKKTKYVKTKRDRKLKETYPKEFVAVYKALEQRCYTDPDGVTATVLFRDLKKKHQRKIINEILDGASWAKERRTGKYVHVLGAAVMAMMESNESKFFAWLKTKAAIAKCQEMQKAKSVVSMILIQKKVIKKPLFSIESADEVSAIINKIAPCFASSKNKNTAVQLVTFYATYLKEKASAPHKAEKAEPKQTPGAENTGKQIYLLHVGDKIYRAKSPAVAFAHFCEEMAVTYPLKIRSLVGMRIRGSADVPLKSTNDGNGNRIKMATVNAYVDGSMQTYHAEDYTRWVCDMCAVMMPNVTMSVEQSEPVIQVPTSISDGKDTSKTAAKEGQKAVTPAPVLPVAPLVQETTAAVTACQPKKKDNPLVGKMEQIVLRADIDGMSYDDLKETLQITMVLTKQLVAQSAKIVDIKGVLIHEEAFIDWEDGADALESIIEKLMQKNNGYVSSTQLFEYARIEMNLFLNDNDMFEERAVYDMAQHLFEKAHYHGKTFAFRGKMHISRIDARIGSNMDIYKKYASDQGGVFNFNGLVEYLESIGVGAGNLRTQMRMQTEPIFFYYDQDLVIYTEALHIDDAWKKSIAKSLQVLFDDAGDHMILRNIPAIWFDRLPAISGNRPWTPLLLQSVLRFFSEELGARTIQALDGQSLETVHTMLVANTSPIQNFGDVIISYMLEQNIERRKYEAEELRLLLVDSGILHGNELIWNMPKALKGDGRFAWDASGNQVTVKI